MYQSKAGRSQISIDIQGINLVSTVIPCDSKTILSSFRTSRHGRQHSGEWPSRGRARQRKRCRRMQWTSFQPEIGPEFFAFHQQNISHQCWFNLNPFTFHTNCWYNDKNLKGFAMSEQICLSRYGCAPMKARPSACGADVIPLHHVPLAAGLSCWLSVFDKEHVWGRVSLAFWW